MDYLIKPSPTPAAPAQDMGVSVKTKVKLSESGGVCVSLSLFGILFAGINDRHFGMGGDRLGTFSFTVQPTHPSRPIENAVVRWYLGSDVALEKVSATIIPGGSNEAEVGRWEVDGVQKVCFLC